MKIYVAGHNGLVGSALVRELRARGYDDLLLRRSSELDLRDQALTYNFLESEKPDVVFLAAARVGGILANDRFRGDFIRDNVLIQSNVIEGARRAGVSRLFFLGSSCIYPKFCPQPIKEEYLLSGELEWTNRPYAVAKIAGVEMCDAYRRQYGLNYVSVMPTNLYGPGDTYHKEHSHVIPAMILKMHEAKVGGADFVECWGSGGVRREFLHSADLARGLIHLMELSGKGGKGVEVPGLVNLGCGEDVTIRELAELVREVVGFDGEILWNRSMPDGTPRKLLDVSRMGVLGWRAEIGLRDGLEGAYADFQLNSSLVKVD